MIVLAAVLGLMAVMLLAVVGLPGPVVFFLGPLLSILAILLLPNLAGVKDRRVARAAPSKPVPLPSDGEWEWWLKNDPVIAEIDQARQRAEVAAMSEEERFAWTMKARSASALVPLQLSGPSKASEEIRVLALDSSSNAGYPPLPSSSPDDHYVVMNAYGDEIYRRPHLTLRRLSDAELAALRGEVAAAADQLTVPHPAVRTERYRLMGLMEKIDVEGRVRASWLETAAARVERRARQMLPLEPGPVASSVDGFTFTPRDDWHVTPVDRSDRPWPVRTPNGRKR